LDIPENIFAEVLETFVDANAEMIAAVYEIAVARVSFYV
jgi:hypothetical protein